MTESEMKQANDSFEKAREEFLLKIQGLEQENAALKTQLDSEKERHASARAKLKQLSALATHSEIAIG
jgi:cell division septum initiation protein DivIVA